MATYSEIQAQIEQLKQQAEAVRKEETQSAIAQIRQLMADFNLSIEDIQGSKTKGRKVKVVGSAKYRNPETGKTWSGRGRQPQWIIDAEAAGKSREEFAIA